MRNKDPMDTRTISGAGGFTAIELLVVVAVVALAAAMLAPTFAHLREGSRTRVCLNNLKRIGHGILEYTADHEGTLPGPVHPDIAWNAAPFYLAGGEKGETCLRHQMMGRLEAYIASSGDDAKPADLLPFCPTSAGIEVDERPSRVWYYRARSYYLVNTVSGRNTPGQPVLYATDPIRYFGVRNPLDDPPPPDLPEPLAPKKLDTIPNHSTEWAVADLWYWEALPNPFAGAKPVGTWPYPLSSGATSTISNEGNLTVPSYPFHLTTKAFSPTGTDRNLNTPRLTSGKTNAVFFDGHAASVRPWTGTVNPMF